jgi:hypothetical protein
LNGLSRCQSRGRRPAESAIRACRNAVHADPNPFRWTKSAADPKPFCLKTLDFASAQAEIAKTSE